MKSPNNRIPRKLHACRISQTKQLLSLLAIWLTILTHTGLAQESWSQNWIEMIGSDWNYMTDPTGDHNPASVDVINNGVPLCCYFASSSTSVFYRMALRGDPINSKGELDQYAWMAQIDIADDGNSNIDLTVRAEGITEYISTYNGSGTQLWTVADPISAGYVRAYPSGSIYYLEMQAPYSALGGITRDTPIRFFFHTSTTETNDIKDATVPSSTISGAFAESGTTTLGGNGGYGFMFDSKDTNPYSNAGSYNSGEQVYIEGYGWPSSATLNVRLKNSGASVMWSGTVSSDGNGNVTSTASWTIDYSASSGIYTIAVQSPMNGTWYNYDDFTVVQLMEPEINIVGHSVTISDGDNSPSATDDTDFGTIDLTTGVRDHTFTIQNIGNTGLTLSASPAVSISGPDAGDFTVTQEAASPVAPGNAVTFTIRFDPSAVGIRSATVSIANNDSNENPYDFAIQGTGALIPEMDVTGNDISIENGDSTPNSTDETYFGDVPTNGVTQVHTYKIKNYGSADLILTGTPLVTVSGVHAADFTVTQQPASPVSTGDYTTFVVTFDPSALGSRTAIINISNNDLDENPYTFSVEGTGVSNGSPFPCTSRFYHFYGSGTLAYLNTGSNPFGYSIFGSASSAINAVGYNVEDGLMYANRGASLIRIDGNGVVTVLSVTYPFASISAAGDCDNGGNYYFISSAGDEVAKYDVSANTITTASLSGGTFSAQDMAFISGNFYGVNGTTLYQFSPSGNSVSTRAITGTLAVESGLNSGFWSAAWAAADGYLYVVDQTSHRFYKIDVSAGLSFYAGSGSGSVSNSDGASCPSASSPLPDNGSAGNYVWVDYDNDGIQESGEPALAGVTVTLYRRDGIEISSTASASDGTYSFTGIPPEQYYLTFSTPPPDYSLGQQNQGGNDSIDSDPDPSTGRTDPFIIDAYDSDNTWDAACVTTGVGNFVWNDKNHNGLQDSGEPGVANVTVTLELGNGTAVASTVTNGSGAYQIIGLTPGTQYQLRFTGLPDGYDFTAKNQGSDETIDSDVNQSTAKTGKFTLSNNAFDQTWDAGLTQTAFPEIQVKGNSTDIADGDTSPSVTDDTDFGSALVGSGVVDHTFTILDTGSTDLSVSLSITGTHAADFSVISAPLSPVVSGDSTTFTVRFDPGAAGLRSAIMSIANNDTTENPYDFVIQGTGLAPEINVLGNGISIAEGDNTPVPADHTDFGAADTTSGSIVHTFTIENTGTSDLTLTGVPIVEISGSHSSDFAVTAQPASGTVGSSGSVTFEITFDPSDIGLREAGVSIANSDSDEDPYTFSIQGTGTSGPEMDVQGKGVSIADGDVTPSTADDTNFGTVNIDIGSISRTFTIYNTGNTALDLTGTPIVALSGGTEFSVTTQPSSATLSSGGGSVSFVISFNPTSIGSQTVTVTIANTDSDENPYSFTLGGEGITEPEMDVIGNGIEITDGDNTPALTDDTDWGTVDLAAGAITHTFTILNEGNAVLNLTGAPRVSISGSTDFSVSTQPASATVSSGGGSEIFIISFSPASTGVKTATIRIDNNDPEENPYSFAVQGEGISVAEITLLGNGNEIPDGDVTPSAADDTDFGNWPVSSGALNYTFTIRNNGSSDLSLTGTPLVDLSGSSDFAIISQPAAGTISSGGTVSFSIAFDPSGMGSKTATVTIDNSDSDENPYTFIIQGTGTSPVLVLSKSVDKASAVPGEILTYTIDYDNTGTSEATAITILEPIPSNTTFVAGSVTASGMVITFSHDSGVSYNGSDTAPVTHIKFQRAAALPAGNSGSITFTVQIE
jgi:uncharacterized repeat protein (TIGR01451 family)